MRAVSSTTGPRDVLTSSAVDFISANSAAPTRPRVRSLSTRWMVRTSARLNHSSIHGDFMIGGDDVAVSGLTETGAEVPVLRGGVWQL